MAAAAFGTVAVFPLGAGAGPEPAAAGPAALEAAGGAVSLCLGCPSGVDTDSSASLILSVACLGKCAREQASLPHRTNVPRLAATAARPVFANAHCVRPSLLRLPMYQVHSCMRAGSAPKGVEASAGERRLAVLHQRPNQALAVSLLRYCPAPAAASCPASPGVAAPQPGVEAAAGAAAAALGPAASLVVERTIEFASSLLLSIGVKGEGWGGPPPRQLLAVPGAPSWLLLVRSASLWLLHLGADSLEGGFRHGKGLSFRTAACLWPCLVNFALLRVRAAQPCAPGGGVAGRSQQVVAAARLAAGAEPCSPGSRAGLSLLELVATDSLITAAAWDAGTSSSTRSAQAGSGAAGAALALAPAGHAQALPLPAAATAAAAAMNVGEPLALTPADTAMEPPKEGVMAPTEMALDLPGASAAEQSVQHGAAAAAPQHQHRPADEHDMPGWRSTALVYSCEDGSVWRVDLVWGADPSSPPTTRLHRCFEAVRFFHIVISVCHLRGLLGGTGMLHVFCGPCENETPCRYLSVCRRGPQGLVRQPVPVGPSLPRPSKQTHMPPPLCC